MSDERQSSLLAYFSDFYEEVARLKLAIHDGRLPLYLNDGKDSGTSLSANDLAAAVSQRLKSRLQQQMRAVRQNGTEAELDSYRVGQYAMVALADELFIFDVDWPGRDAWSQYLLEQGLFESSSAGRDVFHHLDELLKTRARTAMHDDLAAVFLMTLRLGFKGQHRGNQGAQTIKGYRDKLIQFLGAAHVTTRGRPAFAQAYQYHATEVQAQRLAPLSRWYRVAAGALLVYLVLSTAVWVHAMRRFGDVFVGT